MNEIPTSPDRPAGAAKVRQKLDIMLMENAALRKTVSTLQQQLHAIGESASAQHDQQQQLNKLLEANQHLVLATFGAQDSKTAAEAVNQRQTVFLSMLAHELRNPMASIAIANSVLENLNLIHPSVGKMLAITRRQVNHLVRLVDDLLDASRISTGKISLQTHIIALSDVLDSAIETAQPSFSKRGQAIQISLPPSPVILLADLVRLSQMFANLLINASKFSGPDATVWLTALVEGDHLRVTVTDHGTGIALKYHPGIFDLFSQGEDAIEHSLSGGLGIGLSLVRTIAEMHGGSVTVASAGVGCGSEFAVMLPLPAISASPAHLVEHDTSAKAPPA